MMKKVLLLFSTLLLAFFLMSCSPSAELSDEELDQELSELNKEELAYVNAGDTALAGQATGEKIDVEKKKRLDVVRERVKDKRKEEVQKNGELAACADTDAGRDYLVQGTVSGGAKEYTDECQSDEFLFEHDCGYAANVEFQDGCGHGGLGGCQFRCADLGEGFACSEGACVQEMVVEPEGCQEDAECGDGECLPRGDGPNACVCNEGAIFEDGVCIPLDDFPFWDVQFGPDHLEMWNTGDQEGEFIGTIADFIDDSELDILQSGEFMTPAGRVVYEQFIHFPDRFGRATGYVHYEEDDDDIMNLFLKFPDNTQMFRYELDFIESPESSLDGDVLDDYIGRDISILGQDYRIARAFRPNGDTSVSLVLMQSATSDQLREGEERMYNIDGVDYDVEAMFIDRDRVRLTVNGEQVPFLHEGETATLNGGLEIGVYAILFGNGANPRVDIGLGITSTLLRDDDIEASGSTHELRVNGETIDGVDVELIGTLINDGLEIDRIWVNMTTQDDYTLLEGGRLSLEPEFEEKDLLFGQNWDVQFRGLSQEVMSQISLEPANEEREYQLTFENMESDEINIPLYYAAEDRFGDEDDVLHVDQGIIEHEGYFILNSADDGTSVTHVVQYKGAEVGIDETKVKFKVLASGETVDRTMREGEATLRLSGNTYTFGPAQGEDVERDDFALSFVGSNEGPGMNNILWVNGGGKITLENGNDHRLTLETPEGDYENVLPTPVMVVMSNDGGEVRAQVEGLELDSPDDEDFTAYGYTSYGTYVTHHDPAGASADSVSIGYPHNQRFAQVRILAEVARQVVAGVGPREEMPEGECATRLEHYPCFFVEEGNFNGFLVVGENARPVDLLAAVDIAANMRLQGEAIIFLEGVRLDSEIDHDRIDEMDLLSVGSPCVNTVSAAFYGNPADCTEGLRPGEGRVKLFEHAHGTEGMVVDGFTGADTRLMGGVIAHRPETLFGRQMSCEGITWQDAICEEVRAEPAE